MEDGEKRFLQINIPDHWTEEDIEWVRERLSWAVYRLMSKKKEVDRNDGRSRLNIKQNF